VLDSLDSQLEAVAQCGLPDTLVHGDLHPGNVRGTPDGPLVILDWGDCFLGHPAFDIIRLTEGLPAAEAVKILDAWAGRWHSTTPGSEPNRAAQLIRPILALRSAAVYADFLANIEITEHPYHASDVDRCVEIAIRESERTGL
jgi:aminoglycoside phosphotransferase (APT) family kinase protein